MLIQPITNQKYNTNIQLTKQNANFRGQLGEKVLQEITAKTPVNNMLKKLGLGVLGFVSVAKLKDILETWKEKTEKIDIIEKDLVTQEQINKKINEELNKKEIELNERKNELNKEKEKLDKYSYELDEKERDLKQQKQELEKRKKNIEETTRANVTAQIRAEEEKKAEENVINIMNALDERENAITNAENLVRETEIENIKNGFRALYDDKDIDISKVTDYGTQLLILVNTFKGMEHNTCRELAESELIETVLNKMRNKEKVITKEMFQFVKLLLTSNCNYYDLYDYAKAIDIVKDKNGNLDLDKSSYLLAQTSIKKNMIPVINTMANHYELKNNEIKNIQMPDYEERIFIRNLNALIENKDNVLDTDRPDTVKFLMKKIKNLNNVYIIEMALHKLKTAYCATAVNDLADTFLELQNYLEERMKEKTGAYEIC